MRQRKNARYSASSDAWTSTGSSIVESTRLPDVSRIYMLFAKLGGRTHEFRCRPYEKCLSNIAVTHALRNPDEALAQDIADNWDEQSATHMSIDTWFRLMNRVFGSNADLRGVDLERLFEQWV